MNEFPGDEASAIKNVQHQFYLDTLWMFVRQACGAVSRAERLLSVPSTALGQFCMRLENESFDHRVLQSMHDQIAAWFRFVHHRWPLLSHEQTDTETKVAWQRFAANEFQALFKDEDFASGFFQALRFSNNQEGMEGEAAMQRVQRRRYSTMHAHALPRPDTDQETK